MNKYSRRHQKFDYSPIWYLSVSHICLNTFHGSDTYRMITLLINFSSDSTSYSNRNYTLPFIFILHYTLNCNSFFHRTNNKLLITDPTLCIPSQTLLIKNRTYLFSWGLCASKEATKFGNTLMKILSHIFISFPI